MEGNPTGALNSEVAVWAALRAINIVPTAVHSVESVAVGQHVRVALDPAAAPGQARNVISALFALRGMKHVVVVDPDVDVRNDADVERAMSTLSCADRDVTVAEGFPAYHSDLTFRRRKSLKVASTPWPESPVTRW